MTTNFTDLLMADLRASPTCTVVGIVEMSRLEAAQREELMAAHDGSAWPLLSQPVFENLRQIGPWLFGPGNHMSLEGQHAFHRALAKQAGDAVCGWITSELPAVELVFHLSGANIASAPDGACYLLRYHTDAAVPVLHARRQQPRLRELFAPVTKWWYPLPHVSRKAWASVEGDRARHAVAIAPITLDESTWNALAGDPLAYALADQLKATLAARQPETDCYGTRLGIVRRHLAQARQQGLTRPGDLGDYVTLMVQQDHTLTTDPRWQGAVDEAKSGGRSLAQSYRALRFKA